jgi:hypothetical protein
MQEWQFWGLVWLTAAAAGVARCLRDSDYRSCIDLVSIGLFSGMVGVGVVGFWVGSAGGHIGYEPRYLGLSALLGLAGKEQDRFVRFIITTTFDRLGVFEVSEQESVLGDDSPVDRDNDPDTGSDLEHDQPED